MISSAGPRSSPVPLRAPATTPIRLVDQLREIVPGAQLWEDVTIVIPIREVVATRQLREIVAPTIPTPLSGAEHTLPEARYGDDVCRGCSGPPRRARCERIASLPSDHQWCTNPRCVALAFNTHRWSPRDGSCPKAPASLGPWACRRTVRGPIEGCGSPFCPVPFGGSASFEAHIAFDFSHLVAHAEHVPPLSVRQR